jgi:hypothetical protein
MKRIAVGLIIAAVAASPAMAKKVRGHDAMAQATEPTYAGLNDNAYRFVRDSLPLYWPCIIKAWVYGFPSRSR